MTLRALSSRKFVLVTFETNDRSPSGHDRNCCGQLTIPVRESLR